MNDAKPPHHLQLDGALTVPRADEIQGRILATLNVPGAVAIDVSGATEIDVSFLQILVAAHKTASSLRKPLSLVCGGSTLLMDEAARCGLRATTAITGARVLPEISQGTA